MTSVHRVSKKRVFSFFIFLLLLFFLLLPEYLSVYQAGAPKSDTIALPISSLNLKTNQSIYSIVSEFRRAELDIRVSGNGTIYMKLRLKESNNTTEIPEFLRNLPDKVSTCGVDFISEKIVHITITSNTNFTSSEINSIKEKIVIALNSTTSLKSLEVTKSYFLSPTNEYTFLLDGEIDNATALLMYFSNKIKETSNSNFITALSRFIALNNSSDAVDKSFTVIYYKSRGLWSFYVNLKFLKVFTQYKYIEHIFNITEILQSERPINSFDLGKDALRLQAHISIFARSLQLIDDKSDYENISIVKGNPFDTMSWRYNTTAKNITIPVIKFKAIFGAFPFLRVYKMAFKSLVTQGSQVIISLFVSNFGYGPAYNVTIKDEIPDGFELVNGSLELKIKCINITKWQKIGEYTVRAVKTGYYTFPNGTVTYYDLNGTEYHTAVETVFSIVVKEDTTWIRVALFFTVFLTLVTIDIYHYRKKKRMRKMRRYKK